MTDPAEQLPGAELDARFVAGVKLIERSGATGFRIGFSDEDDGDPVVWYAVATWDRARIGMGEGRAHKVGAGLDPVGAVMELCENTIDGGRCQHCRRPTSFLADLEPAGILDTFTCVYQWDPELATFRRSCEGEFSAQLIEEPSTE